MIIVFHIISPNTGKTIKNAQQFVNLKEVKRIKKNPSFNRFIVTPDARILIDNADVPIDLLFAQIYPETGEDHARIVELAIKINEGLL
jgi:hypothetical protein